MPPSCRQNSHAAILWARLSETPPSCRQISYDAILWVKLSETPPSYRQNYHAAILWVKLSETPPSCRKNSHATNLVIRQKIWHTVVRGTWKYDDCRLKMSHSGCALVWHFQPRVVIFPCPTHYRPSSVKCLQCPMSTMPFVCSSLSTAHSPQHSLNNRDSCSTPTTINIRSAVPILEVMIQGRMPCMHYVVHRGGRSVWQSGQGQLHELSAKLNLVELSWRHMPWLTCHDEIICVHVWDKVSIGTLIFEFTYIQISLGLLLGS